VIVAWLARARNSATILPTAPIIFVMIRRFSAVQRLAAQPRAAKTIDSNQLVFRAPLVGCSGMLGFTRSNFGTLTFAISHDGPVTLGVWFTEKGVRRAHPLADTELGLA
jgi:hypothetical protein